MRDALMDMFNTEPCEGCNDRIRVHAADESDETVDDHVTIEHTPEGSGMLGGDDIYYHTDCAPLGGTRIPDQLGFDGGDDDDE